MQCSNSSFYQLMRKNRQAYASGVEGTGPLHAMQVNDRTIVGAT